MSILNLDEKNKWSLIERSTSKEIFDFFRIGILPIKGSTYMNIEKCKCGKTAKYVFIKFEGKKFINIDYYVSFLCKECFTEHSNIQTQKS